MAENNNPSIDPADDGTLAGTLRLVLRKTLQATDGMLPATVVATDSNRQYVTVKPSIMVLGTDGSLTSRAQIARVPLFTIGAGNFVLTFPVSPGDTGWIMASDRDISLYLQSGNESGPNTLRLHSFEDGLFIPDAARRYTLAGEDANNAVLQSLDGSVRLALGPGLVKITATSVHMTGNLLVDGTITGTTDVVGGGKSLKTHTHSGVTTGGGVTGPPV